MCVLPYHLSFFPNHEPIADRLSSSHREIEGLQFRRGSPAGTQVNQNMELWKGEHECVILNNQSNSLSLKQSELYHWIDVLDLFDSILEKGVSKQWSLPCDNNEALKDLLIHVVVFTSLLIEHSFSRHLYNSMEHLTTLLSSSDMQIVLTVLNLLYVFSKRSNFISRLSADRRQALIQRLNYLAEVCITFLAPKV
jgi:hypothetical protein